MNSCLVPVLHNRERNFNNGMVFDVSAFKNSFRIFQIQPYSNILANFRQNKFFGAKYVNKGVRPPQRGRNGYASSFYFQKFSSEYFTANEFQNLINVKKALKNSFLKIAL